MRGTRGLGGGGIRGSKGGGIKGSLTEEGGRGSLIGWKGSIGAGIRGSLPVLAGSKGSLGIARMKKPTFAENKAVEMDEF